MLNNFKRLRERHSFICFPPNADENMAIYSFVCILALSVQMQFPSARCTPYFSTQDDSKSDDLHTLFGEKYKSDLQSLALAFKSGSEPQPFAKSEPVTDLQENDDLQSTKLSMDVLETDKQEAAGDSKIGEYEDLSYTGSRKTNIWKGKPIIKIPEGDRYVNNFKVDKTAGHSLKISGLTEVPQGSSPARKMLLRARVENAKKGKSKGLVIKDEKPNDHEAITKMTLYNILSQPEQMNYTSGDGQYSDAGKTSDITNGDNGSEKRLEDSKMQKSASFVDDKQSIAAFGSAVNQETVGSGVEASGQLYEHNQTIVERLKAVNRSGHEENQANGEPEFSERDPLTIFLETSGSGDDQYSGSGMAASNHLHQQAPTLDENSKTSKEGSALNQNVPLKTDFKYTGQTIKGEDESGSGIISVDPLLLLQVRKIRINVLKAEKQATKELNDVRKDFRVKMEDLEEDLKMVKKLTGNAHKKVRLTVTQALAVARQAKSNATRRLYMARRSATALNNIEKRLGVVHTRNASRILRSRIPQFPNMSDVALYKQLLATDAILTKLDGAKTLAVYRAEKRFHNEEETGSSIADEVDSLRDELASAEKELNEETEAEMEDEREAQEKLEEAMQRNKLVAKKTAFALAAIENYLQKLQSDESKLKRLRFY